MILDTIDAAVVAGCLVLSYAIYKHPSRPPPRSTPTLTPSDAPPRTLSQGYILTNKITHSRLIPTTAQHSFTYPTLSLLVSLSALESCALDLGWVFGYGSSTSRWGWRRRIVGLRAEPYLMHVQGREMSGVGIREKLKIVLARDDDGFDDAWMMTMPSLLGYEGINPLTVYFCYTPAGVFGAVVLEIHNTFGEMHVHVLRVGKDEDEQPARGYDHQWTFLRELHVSPFNDRSGFYTVSIKAPSHPPSSLSTLVSPPPPCPSVRIHLHEPKASPISLSTDDDDDTQEPSVEPGPLKLLALQRVTSAIPLTTPNIFLSLLRAPFALFLSMPRIMYQAWVIHYRKRLDVHARPDPRPTARVDVSEESEMKRVRGVGVKWQEETWGERVARRRCEGFLERRTRDLGVGVILVSGDPTVPKRIFDSSNRHEHDSDTLSTSSTAGQRYLTITYLSPRFFSTLYMAPSAWHALLVGCKTDKTFLPSDESLFLKVFNGSPEESGSDMVRMAQKLRCRNIPSSLLFPSSSSSSSHSSSPFEYGIPVYHPLDTNNNTIASIITVLYMQFLDVLEKWAFTLVGARFVKGEEPWLRWERAAAVAGGVFLR